MSHAQLPLPVFRALSGRGDRQQPQQACSLQTSFWFQHHGGFLWWLRPAGGLILTGFACEWSYMMVSMTHFLLFAACLQVNTPWWTSGGLVNPPPVWPVNSAVSSTRIPLMDFDLQPTLWNRSPPLTLYALTEIHQAPHTTGGSIKSLLKFPAEDERGQAKVIRNCVCVCGMWCVRETTKVRTFCLVLRTCAVGLRVQSSIVLGSGSKGKGLLRFLKVLTKIGFLVCRWICEIDFQTEFNSATWI